MAATPSNMLTLGTPAPAFTLPDTVSGKNMSLAELKSERATVIMFICNHCPYVKHVQPQLVKLAQDYRPQGVAFVAISSNDVAQYPDDGPEAMKADAERLGYDLSLSLSLEGAARAVQMAITQAGHPLDGLIHHSDHGVQYTSEPYRELLGRHHIRSSMGEVDNCYDNAVAERVNGILKLEYGLDETFVDLAQAQRAVEQAVWLYNHERPHLALNYQKPYQVYVNYFANI